MAMTYDQFVALLDATPHKNIQVYHARSFFPVVQDFHRQEYQTLIEQSTIDQLVANGILMAHPYNEGSPIKRYLPPE